VKSKTAPTRRYYFLFSISIAVFAAAFIHIIEVRTSLYPYDVTKDYTYRFPESSTTMAAVDIHNGKLILPHKDSREQTSFLKMQIAATFWGKVIVPVLHSHLGRHR
jgi:hypothetical protein